MRLFRRKPNLNWSTVRNESGELLGLWVEDWSDVAAQIDADTETLPRLFAIANAETPGSSVSSLEDILNTTYRIVPNCADENGGVFLMIGRTRAPGEDM